MPGATLFPLSLWCAFWCYVLGVLCLTAAHRRRGETMSPSAPLRVTAFLLLAVAAACSWFGYRKLQIEHAATDATRVLSGKPNAGVSCNAVQNEYFANPAIGGWVAANEHGELGHKARLSRDVCVALGNWLRSSKHHPTRAQAVAVHVVAHEAGHIAGIREEVKAECWALRRDVQAAMLLGADRDQAREVARIYKTEVWPHLPGPYVGACD